MADPLDVLTLAEARDALSGLSGPSPDLKLAGLVTAVSRRLDEACGPIVKRTVTELHREPGLIFLNGKPITGGTFAITEAWSSETPVAVDAADYVLDDDGVTATIARWSSRWASRVTVEYEAGRFDDTESVGEPFKSAARRLLQAWWRPAEGGGSETYGAVLTAISAGAFPDEVAEMLTGELLPPAIA